MKSTLNRRGFLVSMPALALVPRALAQAPAVPPIRVRGLSQMTLTVSDVKKSLDFYQALFGMPVQARHGSTVLLRVGSGPQFVALKPAAAGERPSISAFGMAVEGFNADRIVKILAEHGVTPADAAQGPIGAMKVRMTTRDGTPEIFVGDPSGIVFQLHDVSYCGGSGPLGNTCRNVEPAPAKGLLAMRDMSHFTIGVADAQRTVTFYQGLFGMPVQVSQGPTPAYAVGPGVHFLMFTGGGGARGAAPAAGRGNAGRAGADGAAARGGAAPAGRGGALRGPAIDHACMGMDNFNPETVTKILSDFGIKPQQGGQRDPLVTYISMRMPNRGGAENGTPELYLTDPDGLPIQIQDVKYCGGGGFLGDLCP
jgi:catechol 2,3-dioxygenase-like lactoylglutathione lyase family enzyme